MSMPAKMDLLRKAAEAGDLGEEISQGEITGMIIQEMGGKRAFAKQYAKAINDAPDGSVAKMNLMRAVVEDQRRAAENSSTNVDDLDEDALEELLIGYGKKVKNAEEARARLERGSEPAATGEAQAGAPTEGTTAAATDDAAAEAAGGAGGTAERAAGQPA